MTSEIVLDPWQKEALEHKGDLILCTGRQIGKTYIMAEKAKKRMIEKPNTRIIIVSLSEDQAKLIINMILTSIEKTNKKQLAKGKDKPTQNKVTLTNGSSALARPVGTTGDAIRGFTGDVLIIDEGSRFPELAFTSGEPTLLSTGGEVWMASTPFGKQGYFWEQFNAATNTDNSDDEVENVMGWKVIHVNGEEAIKNRPISSFWTQEKREKAIKRLESLRRRWSDLRYGQEILAQFLDDLQRFFPDELIQRRCTLQRPKDIKLLIGKNYLGVDIARMGSDEGTYEVILEHRGYYRHVENIITKKQLTTETEQKIIEVADKWNARKVGIDAGAGTLGVSVLDHLLQTKIKHKVVAINNRTVAMDDDEEKTQRILKEDLYFNLKAMLEHGELDLLNEPEVRMSLASVQYEYVKTPSTLTKIRIFGNYTHVVEGLIRAAWLAKKEKSLNLYAI